MSKKHEMQENEKQLLKNLEEELYSETFLKDEPEFSPEKIEHIVGLLELDNPTDEQEMEESLKQFEKRFQEMYSKEIRRDKFKKYCNKLAGIAAVLMLVFMAADITTNAVMDESLFHMVCRWKNQIEIIPGKEDTTEESLAFAEGEVKTFSSAEEFDKYFEDDFLVCTWLPEDIQLSQIYVNNMNEFPEIVWKYNDTNSSERKIEVWFYRDATSDTAGLAGTLVEENVVKEKKINGRKVTYYSNNDSLLAGFEYDNWWYIVSIAPFDENILTSIVEGMREYEAME